MKAVGAYRPKGDKEANSYGLKQFNKGNLTYYQFDQDMRNEMKKGAGSETYRFPKEIKMISEQYDIQRDFEKYSKKPLID